MVGDWALRCAAAFWLLHAMHKLVAIHLAVGIHRHLATRVAGKRVDARATKAKAGNHGRLAVRSRLDQIGACLLQALLKSRLARGGRDEYKLVSANAKQQLVMLHGFGERAANAQDIAVAFGVAEYIVAMFKVIDINIGTGEGVTFAPELIGVSVESAAVAKIGERVDMGAAFEQLALLLQDGMGLLQLLANTAQLRGQCRDIELGGRDPIRQSLKIGDNRLLAQAIRLVHD